MRQLTVRRRKVFNAFAAKARVYIEDPYHPEITIEGTPCRKLGDLKNGGELSVLIGDESVRLFVIADKLTKSYSGDYYQIPEGSDDIVLTGQYQMTPGGNLFRFDDNDTPGIQTHRKKRTVVATILLVAALIIGLCAGRLISGGLFRNRAPKPEDFTLNGMTITLTKDFTEDNVMGFTSSYRSKDVYALALREAFLEAEGLKELSLEEYRDLLMEVNELADARADTFDGIPGFEYDYEDEDGNAYHDRTFVYRTDDSFWMIQFITFREAFSKYEATVNGWAKSVRFGQ